MFDVHTKTLLPMDIQNDMCAKIPYNITMWAIWVQTGALRIFPLAGDDDDAGQRYLDQDVDLDYQDHGDGGQRDLDQDVDLDDHDNDDVGHLATN